jgi:hypothetical protein
MTKNGSNKIKIKVLTETGEVDRISDNSENAPEPVTPEELAEIYQSPNGFKYVGVILHAVTNPKCTYVITASGRAVKVCR